MKDQHSNFLKMTAEVVKCSKGNSALTSIPAYAELLPKLEIVNGKMVGLSKLIDVEDKTLSVAVENASENVIGLLFGTIKALNIYAEKHNIPSIAASLNISRSELQRASSKTIEAKVNTVVKLAREHTAELGVYSITEAQLATIEKNAQLLTVASDALQAYQEKKKGEVAEFEQQMEEAKELLYDMDSIAEIISLSNPSVYKAYTEARNRKDGNESHFTIVVLNSETGEPEENARVLVQSTTRKVKDQPFVLLDRKTGKTGTVRNGKRVFDIYDVTVEKLGRYRVNERVTLADNTPVRIEIMLKRIEKSN